MVVASIIISSYHSSWCSSLFADVSGWRDGGLGSKGKVDLERDEGHSCGAFDYRRRRHVSNLDMASGSAHITRILSSLHPSFYPSFLPSILAPFQIVVESGICKRLVQLLNHPSSQVVKPALRTIGNVVCAEDDADYTEAILEAGSVVCLKKLIAHPNREIQKEVCRFVFVCVDDHRRCTYRMAALSCIEMFLLFRYVRKEIDVKDIFYSIVLSRLKNLRYRLVTPPDRSIILILNPSNVDRTNAYRTGMLDAEQHRRGLREPDSERAGQRGDAAAD